MRSIRSVHLPTFANHPFPGYSHSDRIGGDTSLLSLERIQKVICEGRDIFNMLPEAYSYRDLLAWMTPEPYVVSSSHTFLPIHLTIDTGPSPYLVLLSTCFRTRKSSNSFFLAVAFVRPDLIYDYSPSCSASGTYDIGCTI